MRLHDALIATARRTPHAVALTVAGRHVSCSDLLGLAAVAALYAVLLAGAVLVPVNPQTRAARLAFLLADTAAACIDAEPEPESPAACGELPPVVSLAELAGVGDTIDADLAALIYTSGSTAEPKGVMLTHLERGYSFPADVLRVMQQEHVTVLPGVPTLFSMYGLTECKRVSFLPPQELDRRPRSVGRGMPNQECWLENEHGERLPNGQRGELIVRGSHVMQGYWRRPVETALRLRPGALPGESVLHTGDLFESDAEGFLYFVSRTDDIIKSRGEKVSPREVEEAVASLPGVAEVVVRGTPDELLGETVTAVIVRESSVSGAELTEARVIRHCRALLENVRVPSRIEFVAALSRSANGKLQRRADG